MPLWFKNLKISIRLFAGSILPVLALIVMSAVVMTDQISNAFEKKRVRQIAELAPDISNLVHELQKERGRSAGFIASNGRVFRDHIAQQRILTNQKLAIARKALKHLETHEKQSQLGGTSKVALQELTHLDAKRSQIDALRMTIPTMAKYYTSTIQTLLSTVNEMHRVSTDDETSKEIASYIEFLQGKERAGLERAMGATGFSSGAFKVDTFYKFVKFIESQNAYFHTFTDLGKKDLVTFYKSTMQGHAVDEVERMRKIAIASIESGNLGGIQSSYWFDTITQKINLLKRVEDRIAETLVHDARASEAALWNLLYIETAVVLSIVFGTLYFAYCVLRTLTSPLGRICKSMTRMAEGEENVEIKDAERLDEIGKMARAVVFFKEATEEKKRLEDEARSKQAEIENEQREWRKQQRLEIINLVGSGLSQLAEGDLTARIKPDMPEGYEALKEDFNSALEKLEKTIGKVLQGSENISTGTQQIAQSSNDLAQRTERQAATLEETAAAVANITTSIRKSADGAARARNVVGVSKNKAEHGGQIVDNAIEAMSKIEKSSSEISQIIGVIDEIAFQTNLLALNAGVEAARAGETGRGFAVVASEVRGLAQRSASAAQTIKDLIESSSQHVSEGVKLVQNSGDALKEIVEGVSEIDQVVTEISNGAEQQAQTLDDVNTAVNEIDTVTQENAAMVEETTEATQVLSVQANDLSTLTKKFKTNASATVLHQVSRTSGSNISYAA